MGQFDRFTERTFNPPPRVMRVFNLIVPVCWVVHAVGTRHLEDILTAAFFVVMLLPAGIAPKAFPAGLAAWDRDRPRLSDAIGFLFTTCASFLLLRYFLDRTSSSLIAVVVALILIPIGHIRRRRRAQSE